MHYIKSQKKRLIIFLLVSLMVMVTSYLRTFFTMPGEITLLEGEEYIHDFKSPFLVNIKVDKQGVIKLNNGEIGEGGKYQPLSKPIMFKSLGNGSVKLKMSILGMIPLRTLRVDVVPIKKVIACGNTIGVKLNIAGVLVIGLTEIVDMEGRKMVPSKESGMKIGDVIVEVNQVKLESIRQLIKEIDKSEGKALTMKLKRETAYHTIVIKPVKSADDSRYHIGLWVRENTAGIGTLTFYDPVSKTFGALGHGITDIDTGSLMPIGSGELLESKILAIKKGKAGVPGELRGVFLNNKNILGRIWANNSHGIYGKLFDPAVYKLPNKVYPVALRSQVKEGRATILSNIDGQKIEEYNIDIIKVSMQNSQGSKGMILKVTDPRLLNATGGIVQGMSGSPILQEGKIIGAVTHVLINDPTRGYGIFIERMLKNIAQDEEMMKETAG